MIVDLSQDEVGKHFRSAELKQLVQMGLLSKEAADKLKDDYASANESDIAKLMETWKAASPQVREIFLKTIGATPPRAASRSKHTPDTR